MNIQTSNHTPPNTSRNNLQTCFACKNTFEAPFAKIIKGHNIHLLCTSQCLDVALRVLNLTSDSPTQHYKEPLSIRVGVPYPHNLRQNADESPSLRRSPFSPNLTKLSSSEDLVSDPEGINQIQTLARSAKRKCFDDE